MQDNILTPLVVPAPIVQDNAPTNHTTVDPLAAANGNSLGATLVALPTPTATTTNEQETINQINCSSISNNNDMSSTTISTQPTATLSHHQNNTDNNNPNKLCTLLHHKDETHYVLNTYCHPVTSNSLHANLCCKFTLKECMVDRSKAFVSGTLVDNLSDSVYIPTNGKLKRYKYNIVDTRLLKCCNPKCSSITTKEPKLFHHVCFMHGLVIKQKEGLEMIELTSEDDKIFDLLGIPVEDRKILFSLSHTQAKVIFPVCGKRCFSNVQKYRLSKAKEASNDVGVYNWEKDGNEHKKSSITILIDWLTTEENATKYFGGSDKNGKTTGLNKDAYHKIIRQQIMKENGSDRSVESIRTKIVRIQEAYKAANDEMIQSGGGLQGYDEESFAKYIRKYHCKYYYELRPIFGNRPNVQPWFTNEGQGREPDDDEDEQRDDESLFSCNNQENNVNDGARDEVNVDNDVVVLDVDTGEVVPNEPTLSISGRKVNTRLNLSELDDSDDDIFSNSNKVQKNNDVNVSSLSEDNISPVSENVNVASTISVASTQSQSRFKRKKYGNNSISPANARRMQRSLLTSHQRQINQKKKKAKITGLTDKEEEEKNFLRETRESKMRLELEVHSYNKKIEEKNELREERKVFIEQEKLRMAKEEREEKKEQAKIQTEMEKTKLLMIKMEMYEKRMKMKRDNPDIDDDFLDRNFPIL